jgi:hypothetical protein
MKRKFLSLFIIIFLLAISLFAFYAPTVKANPSIIRVQGNSSGTSTTSTISVTLVSTPISGNVLVAVVGFFCSASRSVSSISETGVSWTGQIRKEYNLYGVYAEIEIWFGVVSAGASTSITVTLTGAATYGGTADVCEYSGVETTNFLDKTASAQGNNKYPKTGTTATTTQADELWIGGTVLYSYAQTTPTNDFALLDGALYQYESTAYLEKIVSATGTANSQTTGGGIQQWAGCIATFKASVPVAEERSHTFVETMKPSATLYQWQEHSHGFTETLTIGGVSVTTVSYKISSDSDDGYRLYWIKEQSKYLYVTSSLDAAGKDLLSDVYVIDDAFSRFANIAVPNGASILDATITLTAVSNQFETTVKWKILGDLEANSTAITSYDDYTNRPKTTAYVLDNNVTAWTTNNTYTYDITNIVSEIIGQSEWTSNNAMQIFIMDNGSDMVNLHLRGWYDYWFSNTQCAELQITYSTEAPSTGMMLYYWQEQLYSFSEVTKPIDTLYHWIEETYLFFEYTFTEHMLPSATLKYWQEQQYSFIESLIHSETLHVIGEGIFILIETVKPSEIIRHWQEQVYSLVETIQPSGTLYHWVEGIYQFFEYTFTEPITPSAILNYSIERSTVSWLAVVLLLTICFGIFAVIFVKRRRT